MVNVDKIKAIAKSKGISIAYLCQQVGKGRGYLNDVKSGKTQLSDERLAVIARLLQTSVRYLKDETANRAADDSDGHLLLISDRRVYPIPVFESVSAGLGAYAADSVVDYFPCYIDSAGEADETICLRVQGDSMVPKIEDGDMIQVHLQDSVDSGSIAVILIDDEEGLVKRVEYGADWVELQSLNPKYPPRRFEGKALLRLRIVGQVKRIIKEV